MASSLQMSGSTVDAMADAIDHSYAVVYGISLAYKESQNCRLEAMYAHQAKVKMIPLVLQEQYVAKGWLGMLLGTQLWYGFFGSTLTTEATFDKRITELCRALGPPEQARNPLRKATQAIGPSPASTPHASAAVHVLAAASSSASSSGGVEPPVRHTSHSTAPSSPMMPPLPPQTPIMFQTPQTPASPLSSFMSQSPSHPDASQQQELARARESIAKLEERQNRSFVDQLAGVKTIARLESDLKVKEREVAMVRLEAEKDKEL